MNEKNAVNVKKTDETTVDLELGLVSQPNSRIRWGSLYNFKLMKSSLCPTEFCGKNW